MFIAFIFKTYEQRPLETSVQRKPLDKKEAPLTDWIEMPLKGT